MGDRWLGPRHAIRVKKNPLHYSTKIEECRACIRCEAVLHKSAFTRANGREIGVCAECLQEISHRTNGRLGGLPSASH